MPNERLSADKRHLHWLMLVNESEHAFDEGITAPVVHLTERDDAPQVLRLIGIAARAMERTLAGDFDRQQGTVPAKHSAARSQQRAKLDRLARSGSGHIHDDTSEQTRSVCARGEPS
jgi:hypothetical protein